LNIWEQLLLVLGLSMDGFAASICMGMEVGRENRKRLWAIIGLISGCHVGMLLLGYGLGASFRGRIASVYPWAAALILTLLGIHMLHEAGQTSAAEKKSVTSLTSVAVLALATSLDATTVGIAFALYGVPAWQSAGLVAVIMGSLSFWGAAFGGRIGQKYRRGARLAGGVILCIMGVRLLAGSLF
jgi:putative Mn2+ efflux pump MntP